MNYLGVGSRVKHPAFGDGVIIRPRYDRNPRVPDRNDRQFCRNLGCFPSNFADNFSIVPEFAPKSNLQADGYME